MRTVRGLEAEAIHQYIWKYFNRLSACALYLYVPAWHLASCTQLSREALLVTHKVRADNGAVSGHHWAVCAPRKLPPGVQ